ITSNLISVISVVGGSALVLITVTAVRRRVGVHNLTADLWAAANGISLVLLSDVIVRKGDGLPGFAIVIALCVSLGAVLDARYRGDRFWAERMLPSATCLWLGMSAVGVINAGGSVVRT